MRCERCGKFRASKDIAINWHGEMYYGGGEVQECIWCMSPVDKARHGGKTDEAQN